jgi:predicted PurR-regulated permease PerM
MKTTAAIHERLGTVIFYAVVIALSYLTYRILEPFLVALAWAAVLVMVTYPVYDRLTERWGATRAALASTAAVTLILILPILAVSYACMQQGISAVHALENSAASGNFDWMNRLWDHLHARYPGVISADFGATVGRYAQTGAQYVARELGTLLANAALFLFHLLVTIMTMFYFFRDGDSFLARLRGLLPFQMAQRERMLAQAHELVFASVISSAAGAGSTGLLGGIAFAALGITAPVFWGVMMTFFSLLPVVGSAVIWVPAAVGLALSGHVVRGLLLLVVCLVIVSGVDYVLRPWLISGHSQIGGLLIFLGVLGGVIAFGVLGIVLGPIILAMVASLLDLYAADNVPGNQESKAHVKLR